MQLHNGGKPNTLFLGIKKSVLRLVSYQGGVFGKYRLCRVHHHDIIFSRLLICLMFVLKQFSLFLVSYHLRYSWLSVDDLTAKKTRVRLRKPRSCTLIPNTAHETTSWAARTYCQFCIFWNPVCKNGREHSSKHQHFYTLKRIPRTVQKISCNKKRPKYTGF